MSRRWINPVVLFFFALGISASARAGSFTVSPTRVDFSAARPYGVIQITNLSDESATIQVHAFAWRLQNGKEVEVPSDDILLNPPIFSLGSRAKQFMRLGLRTPNNTSGEVTYRVVLEEVPAPAASGFRGLRTVLRLSIPVFAKSATPAAPDVKWTAMMSREGLRVSAVNRGKAHVQIRELQIEIGGKEGVNTRTVQYLLPEQERVWVFEKFQDRGTSAVRVKATTDAGAIHEDLVPSIQ